MAQTRQNRQAGTKYSYRIQISDLQDIKDRIFSRSPENIRSRGPEYIFLFSSRSKMLRFLISQYALQDQANLILNLFIILYLNCRTLYHQLQNQMLKILVGCLALVTLCAAFHTTPASDLDASLESIRDSRKLMGIQLQITNRTHTLYHGNFGSKDNSKPITNDTLFRIASCSKSVAASAVMILVEQGKVSLTQSLSSILGFAVKNPNFPNVQITVQMALSHQSSLIQCEPYYSNFLTDTYNAKTGNEVPSIKQILVEGGKYYNKCLFSSVYAPGTHYQYVNLNFGIAGAIVERASGVRFDIFVRERIGKHISAGLAEVATFNIGTIQNANNLGSCFVGQNGKWVPDVDYYPDGKIPQRNLTGYEIGSNGVIFGPQGGLRASVSHMSNYITMLANKGVTKQGVRVLKSQSVEQILKPRYQYHGKNSGAQNDFHLYGFGIYTTTYRKADMVIPHEVVRGHTGSAYGLISGYYFWGNYTLTYIVNGALNGYGYGTGTIYEKERLLIYEAATKYINAMK